MITLIVSVKQMTIARAVTGTVLTVFSQAVLSLLPSLFSVVIHGETIFSNPGVKEGRMSPSLGHSL